MRNSRLYIILLLCLSFDVYLNVLEGKFVYDDFYFVRDRPGIRAISDVGDFFTDIGKTVGEEMKYDVYRPLSNISLALTYQVFGADPFPYHLINVILHTLNTVLVFYLARRLLNPPSPLPSPTRGEGDSIPSPLMGEGEGEGDHGIASLPLVARNDVMSFFIAAIFAVHPVQTEAVGLIAYRSNSQFLFFLMAAFLVYLRWSNPPQPPFAKGGANSYPPFANGGANSYPPFAKRGANSYPPLKKGGANSYPPFGKGGRGGIYILSLFLYVLSFFSKETGIILPALVLVYYVFVPNGNELETISKPVRPEPVEGRSLGEINNCLFMVRQAHHERRMKVIKRHLIRLLPFFAAGIAFVIVRSIVLGRLSQARVALEGGVFAQVLSMIQSLGMYFKLTLFPLRLTVEYLYPTLPELYSPWTGIALSSIILVIYLGWRLRRVSYIYPLGVAWFLVALLPSLNIIPIRTPLNERFLYLPIIGFAVFLVQGAFDIQESLRGAPSPLPSPSRGEGNSIPSPLMGEGEGGGGHGIAIIFLVVLLCLYSTRTIIRNRDFADPIRFWEAVLRDNPESAAAPLSLGVLYYNMGDENKAVYYYLQAMRQPSDHGMNARTNLARLFKERGDLQRAAIINEDTMRLYPDKPEAYINQGWIYMEQTDYRNAEAMFLTALKLNPDLHKVHESLAELYNRTGRKNLAEDHNRKALELNPTPHPKSLPTPLY